MVCAGETSDHVSQSVCYRYEGGVWASFPSMLQARETAAVVQLTPDSFWVTGRYECTILKHQLKMGRLYLRMPTIITACYGFLSGGLDTVNLIRLETTEIYSATTNSFAYGPNLPIYLERHCMAKIDENQFVVAGTYT